MNFSFVHDVDHSGVSYEGRVFLNNTDANQTTPMDEKSNYAGSYYNLVMVAALEMLDIVTLNRGEEDTI